MTHNELTVIRTIGDIAATSVTVLTIAKVLPAIAAGLAILWYLLSIYEKVTGKQFSDSRFARWLTRK